MRVFALAFLLPLLALISTVAGGVVNIPAGWSSRHDDLSCLIPNLVLLTAVARDAGKCNFHVNHRAKSL